MNRTARREIRNKSRLITGLTNILQYDAENLSTDSNTFDSEQILITIQDMRDTLQNLMDVIAEIEYRLYLDRLKES